MEERLVEFKNWVLFSYDIEDLIKDENVILDEGFAFEVYGNPEGKYYVGERSKGASVFVYMDKDVTYGSFLGLFEDLGNVRDDTLSIRIVEPEEPEFEMCKENPISRRKG